MSDENKKDEPRAQADNDGIAIGNISAGGNIHLLQLQCRKYKKRNPTLAIKEAKHGKGLRLVFTQGY